MPSKKKQIPSKEAIQNLKWIKTEITAGMSMRDNSEAASIWNNCSERALRIIDGYIAGKGLFQI